MEDRAVSPKVQNAALDQGSETTSVIPPIAGIITLAICVAGEIVTDAVTISGVIFAQATGLFVYICLRALLK